MYSHNIILYIINKILTTNLNIFFLNSKIESNIAYLSHIAKIEEKRIISELMKCLIFLYILTLESSIGILWE